MSACVSIAGMGGIDAVLNFAQQAHYGLVSSSSRQSIMADCDPILDANPAFRLTKKLISFRRWEIPVNGIIATSQPGNFCFERMNREVRSSGTAILAG